MYEKIFYCFNYNEDHIWRDIEENGTSIIIERIKAEKKKGTFECATKNPKGR